MVIFSKFLILPLKTRKICVFLKIFIGIPAPPLTGKEGKGRLQPG